MSLMLEDSRDWRADLVARGRWGRQRYRGLAAVWFAIVGLWLFGLFALVIDLGRYYYAFHQLQAAADSSALAGLDYLTTDTSSNRQFTRQRVADVAAANSCLGDAVIVNPNLDVAIGIYDPQTGVFTATTSPLIKPWAIKVSAQRTDDAHGGAIKLIFSWWSSGFGGVSKQTATAVGVLTGGGSGLVVLAGGANALNIQGSAELDLGQFSGVQVNSTSDSAAVIQGELIANHVVVAGNGTFAFTNSNPPPVKTGVTGLDDPLASVPEVDYSGFATYDKDHVPPDPLPPGYYKDGLPGAGPHTLQGGIYALGPTPGGTDGWASGVSYGGSDVGVMLYLLPGVTPEFSNATFRNFRAPDPAQGDKFAGATTYAGISVFQSRLSSPVTVNWNGSNSWSFVGTLYLPETNLALSGIPRGTPTQLVVNTLSITGSGTIRINYNGAFPGAGNYTRALVK